MSIKQFQVLPLVCVCFLLIGNVLAHPLCINGDGGPQRVSVTTFQNSYHTHTKISDHTF